MRDLRDPNTLGRKYLHLRKGGMAIEDAVLVPVHDYSPHETTVTETVEKYRQEMVTAAEEGDVHARDVCAQNEWAYESSGDAQDDVSAPHNPSRMSPERFAQLEKKQCKRMDPHDPHSWTIVGQPGTRTPVELYACRGIGLEYV
jgi:hypothetical protein